MKWFKLVIKTGAGKLGDLWRGSPYRYPPPPRKNPLERIFIYLFIYY